jgi:coenzyme F420-reducing hydrogenase alpha subunit
MNALEAQGQAAQRVYDLRKLCDRFCTVVAEIHVADGILCGIIPHLTPAAQDEITSQIEQLQEKMAAAFHGTPDPVEEVPRG